MKTATFVLMAALGGLGAAAADYETVDIARQSFAWCAGTDENPIAIQLTDQLEIPYSLIGDETKGFGGAHLYQADKALLVKMGDDGEGFLFSPYFRDVNSVSIEFDVKTANEASVDAVGVFLAAYLPNGTALNLGYNETAFTPGEWQHVKYEYSTGSYYAEYMAFQVWAAEFDDYLIKNVVITGKKFTQLSVPGNVSVTDSGNGVFNVKWDAVENATHYNVQTYRMHRAQQDETDFGLVEFDMQGVASKGSVTSPEYPDYYDMQIEQMPGWTLVCPILAKGAAGVEYDLINDLLMGYKPAIKSPVYDLSMAKEGMVSFELEAASPYPNAFTLEVYDVDPGSGTETCTGVMTYQQALGTEFKSYAVKVPGATSHCRLSIAPVVSASGQGAILLKSLGISIDLAAGTEVITPEKAYSTEQTAIELKPELKPGEFFGASVKAMAIDAGTQNVLAESDFSDTVYASSASSVTAIQLGGVCIESARGSVTVSAEGFGCFEVYTIQGLRIGTFPTGIPVELPGGLYLLRIGSATYKVLL